MIASGCEVKHICSACSCSRPPSPPLSISLFSLHPLSLLPGPNIARFALILGTREKSTDIAVQVQKADSFLIGTI